MSNFHTQGAVPLDSPAYVEREFEQGVIKNVFTARWVLVLGQRQHGKTTSLIRVSKNLENSGFLSAFVDLQGLVALCRSYEDLLETFSTKIAESLHTTLQEKPSGTNARQLINWLEKLISPGKQPIVIIIDEASAIENDEWRNIFYSQIRSIKNAQAMAQPDDLVNRLRFVFSGCFRPETLVQTLNSPFNTCEEIMTDDLTLSQAEQLYVQVTGINDVDLVKRIYDLVEGNPYLLQAIFDKVLVSTDDEKEKSLCKMFEFMYSGQDNHFQYLFQRIHEDDDLRKIVSEMAEKSSVANDPADNNSKFLRTLGLAKLDGRNLVFRNKLYKHLAENSILFKNTEEKKGESNSMKTIKLEISNSQIHGGLIISDVINDSFRSIESTDASDDIKRKLVQLGKAVELIADKLPEEMVDEVLEDYKKLSDEAVKKSPKQKWYSVSIDGLQKAAKSLGKMGKPVIELSAELLRLLNQMPK